MTSEATIKVITGDFSPGRAPIMNDGIWLRSTRGRELVHFAAIKSARRLSQETRSTTSDRVKGVAAGSILGGIAAGAMAGGLTGPAGAVIGAAAGALLAVSRKFVTMRIDFADGRTLVAVAQQATWTAIIDRVSNGEMVPQEQAVDLRFQGASNTLLSRLGSIRKKFSKKV